MPKFVYWNEKFKMVILLLQENMPFLSDNVLDIITCYLIDHTIKCNTNYIEDNKYIHNPLCNYCEFIKSELLNVFMRCLSSGKIFVYSLDILKEQKPGIFNPGKHQFKIETYNDKSERESKIKYMNCIMDKIIQWSKKLCIKDIMTYLNNELPSALMEVFWKFNIDKMSVIFRITTKKMKMFKSHNLFADYCEAYLEFHKLSKQLDSKLCKTDRLANDLYEKKQKYLEISDKFDSAMYCSQESYALQNPSVSSNVYQPKFVVTQDGFVRQYKNKFKNLELPSLEDEPVIKVERKEDNLNVIEKQRLKMIYEQKEREDKKKNEIEKMRKEVLRKKREQEKKKKSFEKLMKK